MSAAAGAERTRSRRDPWLLLSIGLSLAALLAVALLNATDPVYAPYDPRSAAPDGTKALWLWLEEMGYRVEDTPRQSFVLPQGADLFFVSTDMQLYTLEEARELERWVEAGGAAVIMANAYVGSPLTDHGQTGAGEIVTWAKQAQPLFPETGVQWEGLFGTSVLESHPSGARVPVIVTYDGEPTLTVRQRGEGTFWYLSDVHPLTNESLRNPNQAAIVAAILRTVPPGGLILFDAYHFYGEQGIVEEPPSLQQVLYATGWGRALLFVLGVGAFYWLLAGRRLGPALPAPDEVRRREAAEYVRAMAGLKRRAHAAPEVAAHHRQRLKSALARTRALDPRIEDVDFTRRLRAYTVLDGSLDEAALAEVEQLLAALHAPADEQALVRAAAGVDRFLDNHR